MRYDGGARIVLPDGSIEVAARPDTLGAIAIGLLVVIVAFGARWPDLFGLCYAAALAAFLLVRSPRFGFRRVRFDATGRTVHISERAWFGRERRRAVPFAQVRDVTVEQRQPRRIRFAPPVLVLNDEELMSVADTHANADLERELQAVVGLPPHPSPRDHEGVFM
jgi:hypothetical protein